MASSTKREVFQHTHIYVNEVFAERLKKEGFCSYREHGLFWFRLINGNVIQSVYFTTQFNSFPVFLHIGYGFHPLFIPPVLQKSPYMYAMPREEQIYSSRTIRRFGSTNSVFRAPDSLVLCPMDEDRGGNFLDEILLKLDPIKTPYDCYEAHKKIRVRRFENMAYGTLTPYFVDEVLFWEDKELYSLCEMAVTSLLEAIDRTVQNGGHLRKADYAERDAFEVVQRVLRENRRDEYMETLHNREIEVLRMLKKNTLIGR